MVVKDDQVAVTDVEPRQMITGILCVKDVLIHHKCCAFPHNCNKILHYLHSDLSYSSIFSENVIHFFRSDLVRQVFHIQDPVHLWWQANLVLMKRRMIPTFIRQIKENKN
ncbi:hypothetical protein EGW08_015735, partial [Elysia chlorotica]